MGRAGMEWLWGERLGPSMLRQDATGAHVEKRIMISFPPRPPHPRIIAREQRYPCDQARAVEGIWVSVPKDRQDR